MARADALDGDAQTQPPYRKLRKLKQSVRGSEGNTVIGTDRPRQAALAKEALKGPKCKFFAVGFQGLTQQQIARTVVGDRERVAIALIAELKLALVVGAPQIVGMPTLRQGVPSARGRRRPIGFTRPWRSNTA